MKYLLTLSVAVLLHSTMAQDPSSFPGQSYNDDVNRKITLNTEGVVDIATDVRFKPISSGEDYYYVIPADNEAHLVSINAVVSNTQQEAKV
jgi:hypothetical protein